MDSAVLAALAALGGSLIGASASVAASWLTQHGQQIALQRATDRTRREVLYSEFINEASRRFADALQAEAPEVAHFVTLLALVGRIRLFADEGTVVAAEGVMNNLLATYFEASITVDAMRDAPFASQTNPLLDFSQAARRELLRLR